MAVDDSKGDLNSYTTILMVLKGRDKSDLYGTLMPQLVLNGLLEGERECFVNDILCKKDRSRTTDYAFIQYEMTV